MSQFTNVPAIRESDADEKPLAVHLESDMGGAWHEDPKFLTYVQSLSEDELAKQEANLVRKIDRRLIPTVFIMMVLNYLDRSALSSARVQGLPKDLKLKGTEFNTAIAVLFAGYIVFQLPANMMMAKWRPSLYLPTVMILWGCVSAATAACHNFVGLVLCRFFLGVLEAPFFPASIFLLSCWYNKSEMAKRSAWLFCGNLLSGAIGGLLAAGIQAGLDHKRGLRAWRWLFIIEGSITVAFALVAFFILPDYPEKGTKWLTPRERSLARWRLEKDHGATDEEPKLWEGVKLAAKDPITWMLAFMVCCKSSAGAVTQFLPTITATFGYSTVIGLVLTAPPYIFTMICSLVFSYTSDKYHERGFHIFGAILFSCCGYIIAAASPAHMIAPRYLSTFIALGGLYGTYNAQLAWVSTSIPEPKAKRAAGYAIVNSLGNASQIWAPYLFPSSSGPRYLMAFSADAGFCVLASCTALLIKYVLWRRNQKREEEQSAIPPHVWDDMPENVKDRIRFRFVL